MPRGTKKKLPSALEAHNARAAAGRERQDLLGAILTPSSLAKVGFLHDAVKWMLFGLDINHVYCVRHVHKTLGAG
jgi:hypothetical protein